MKTKTIAIRYMALNNDADSIDNKKTGKDYYDENELYIDNHGNHDLILCLEVPRGARSLMMRFTVSQLEQMLEIAKTRPSHLNWD